MIVPKEVGCLDPQLFLGVQHTSDSRVNVIRDQEISLIRCLVALTYEGCVTGLRIWPLAKLSTLPGGQQPWSMCYNLEQHFAQVKPRGAAYGLLSYTLAHALSLRSMPPCKFLDGLGLEFDRRSFPNLVK